MRKSVIIYMLSIITIASASAQELKYEKGYLVLKGNRIEQGYIKQGYSSWSIMNTQYGIITFKATPESKRVKVRKKKDVIGFVVGLDSFTIKEHIKVAKGSPTFRKDFVKVLETGKINLYEHECKRTIGFHNPETYLNISETLWYETYLLCKDEKCLSVYDVTDQNDSILELISDDNILVSELQKKDPNEWDIHDLVEIYNSRE